MTTATFSVKARATQRLAHSLRIDPDIGKAHPIRFKLPYELADASYAGSKVTATELRLIYLCYAEYALSVYRLLSKRGRKPEPDPYDDPPAKPSKRAYIGTESISVVFSLKDLQAVLGVQRYRLLKMLEGISRIQVMTWVSARRDRIVHRVFADVEITDNQVHIRLNTHLGNTLTGYNSQYALCSLSTILRLSSIYEIGLYPILAYFSGIQQSSYQPLKNYLHWSGYQHPAFDSHARGKAGSRQKANNTTIFRKKILPELLYKIEADDDSNVRINEDRLVLKKDLALVTFRRRTISHSVVFSHHLTTASKAPGRFRVSRMQIAQYLASQFVAVWSYGKKDQIIDKIKVYQGIKRKYRVIAPELMNSMIAYYDSYAMKAVESGAALSVEDLMHYASKHILGDRYVDPHFMKLLGGEEGFAAEMNALAESQAQFEAERREHQAKAGARRERDIERAASPAEELPDYDPSQPVVGEDDIEGDGNYDALYAEIFGEELLSELEDDPHAAEAAEAELEAFEQRFPELRAEPAPAPGH